MTVLFRQSYAKTLLIDCAALCKKQVDNDARNPSRAMQKGSLLDALAFGQDQAYEVVDARYKSGPREGQPAEDWTGKEAREARDAALARGVTPALQSEVDDLMPTAMAIRERITRLALEMAGGPAGHTHSIYYQEPIEWVSEQGVPCRGTPDVIVLVFMPDLIKVCTIDVKHTAFLMPKKFSAQVYNMCWDVQGMAYAEGAKAWVENEYDLPAFHLDHYILATSSIEDGLPPCARELDAAYKVCGKRRWAKAQAVWQECLASGVWPGYSEGPVTPSRFVMSTEVETYDEGSFTPEDVEP